MLSWSRSMCCSRVCHVCIHVSSQVPQLPWMSFQIQKQVRWGTWLVCASCKTYIVYQLSSLLKRGNSNASKIKLLREHHRWKKSGSNGQIAIWLPTHSNGHIFYFFFLSMIMIHVAHAAGWGLSSNGWMGWWLGGLLGGYIKQKKQVSSLRPRFWSKNITTREKYLQAAINLCDDEGYYP